MYSLHEVKEGLETGELFEGTVAEISSRRLRLRTVVIRIVTADFGVGRIPVLQPNSRGLIIHIYISK
jgi:hypothetical protein